MYGIIFLLVIVFPVAAALRGVGYRWAWFSLSGLALLVALGISVLSVKESQANLDKLNTGTLSGEFDEDLLRECKEDPERPSTVHQRDQRLHPHRHLSACVQLQRNPRSHSRWRAA